MSTIILSYRREDTAWIAGRIHDRLKGHYGADNVFMDIDSIPFGLDFREHIHESLEKCDILLAIIGPDWSAPNDEGQPRMFDETDWVRIEIEAALAKRIPVIPVLIDGTRLPPARALPEGVRDIVFRQAADVDAGRDFHPHMDRLIGVMDQLLARTTPASAAKPSAPQPVKTPENPSAATESIRPVKQSFGARPTEEAVPASIKKWRWPRLRETFFSFQGRLSRQTFLLALIASFIVMIVIAVLLGVLADLITGRSSSEIPTLAVLSPLLWIWLLAAIGGKRLHDFDWSAPWLIIPVTVGVVLPRLLGFASSLTALIFIGGACVVALLLLSPLGFLKGTEGPNRYGPDPLGQTKADAALG